MEFPQQGAGPGPADGADVTGGDKGAAAAAAETLSRDAYGGAGDWGGPPTGECDPRRSVVLRIECISEKETRVRQSFVPLY